MTNEEIEKVRETHKIPPCYAPGFVISTGEVIFSYCEEIVRVTHNGEVYRTYLARTPQGRNFATEKWRPS